MGEKTEIAWCDSTFNPWIGCTKISAGCDHCYAEALMDKRLGRVEWGPHGERKRTSPANWREPVTWNKHFAAFQAKHGRRQRVFCASLADVFDNQVPPFWRRDLFDLIAATPELDWLLLTKRPENIAPLMPDQLSTALGEFPSNIWFGTTAENQIAYDRRWPILARIPARVRFISYEPAIGGLSIDGHKTQPDWIIAGGESGHGFRPANPEWFYDLKRACKDLAVPFFMKQLAGRKPIPDDLMVRQFPCGTTML